MFSHQTKVVVWTLYTSHHAETLDSESMHSKYVRIGPSRQKLSVYIFHIEAGWVLNPTLYSLCDYFISDPNCSICLIERYLQTGYEVRHFVSIQDDCIVSSLLLL